MAGWGRRGTPKPQPWGGAGVGDAHLAPWRVRGPGRRKGACALTAAAASSSARAAGGGEEEEGGIRGDSRGSPVPSQGWTLTPSSSQDRHPRQCLSQREQTRCPWEREWAAMGTDSPLQERPHCTGPAWRSPAGGEERASVQGQAGTPASGHPLGQGGLPKPTGAAPRRQRLGSPATPCPRGGCSPLPGWQRAGWCPGRGQGGRGWWPPSEATG